MDLACSYLAPVTCKLGVWWGVVPSWERPNLNNSTAFVLKREAPPHVTLRAVRRGGWMQSPQWTQVTNTEFLRTDFLEVSPLNPWKCVCFRRLPTASTLLSAAPTEAHLWVQPLESNNEAQSLSCVQEFKSQVSQYKYWACPSQVEGTPFNL